MGEQNFSQQAGMLAPIGTLGIGLGLLIFFPIPGVNHDIVLSIVSGLLGFIVRPDRAKSDPVVPPPV